MKEITARELFEELQGELIEVESVDVYGVSVHMTKAGVDYDEGLNMLTFGTGDCEHGISSVSYDVDDCIDSISYDEDNESYTIEFNYYMADVIVSKSNK